MLPCKRRWALAPDLRSKFQRIVELIKAKGLDQVREPYVKHLDGKLWEMRMIGRDGIARAIYIAASGQRVVVLHAFVKKTEKTPRRRVGHRTRARQGDLMSRKFIPVEESFRKWSKVPQFKRAYDALEEEFALAAALIDARGQAGLSQEDVAARMKTSQQTVSRLEGGRANPSIKTLQRYADATGTRLKISFERVKARRQLQRS
jgi:phage-related protein/DNA-binding XRE family transcriptional regulator